MSSLTSCGGIRHWNWTRAGCRRCLRSSRLAPWAAATAAELRRQLGDDVELTVGALPYPPGARPRPGWQPPRSLGLLNFPGKSLLSWTARLLSGLGTPCDTACWCATCPGSELQIATNGQVTAAVVDPHTGEVVGGYCGAQGMPLKVFRAAPGRKHAGPPADRYGQPHDAPARVHGSRRGNGASR